MSRTVRPTFTPRAAEVVARALDMYRQELLDAPRSRRDLVAVDAAMTALEEARTVKIRGGRSLGPRGMSSEHYISADQDEKDG